MSFPIPQRRQSGLRGVSLEQWEGRGCTKSREEIEQRLGGDLSGTTSG